MKKRGPKTKKDFADSEAFHADGALLRAQEIICSAVGNGKYSRYEVDLLSLEEAKKMSMHDLSKACFDHGYEVDFTISRIKEE